MNTAVSPEEAKAAAAAASAAKAQAAIDAKAAKAAAAAVAKQAKAEEKAAKAAAATELKAAAAAKKIADKAAKAAEAEAAKAANSQPTQNGVTRPKAGTLCAKVWDICDGISGQLQQPAPVDHVMKAGEAEKLHPATIRAQYAHWKKFNGLAGRITLPVPAAPAPAEGQPAA